MNNFQIGKLPEFLKFKSGSDLIRVGRYYDGGYLVSQKDIEMSDFLLSLGINDDWSFEQGFVKINNTVKVHAYDASVRSWHFFKRAVKLLFRLRLTKSLLYIQKFLSFKIFFSGDKLHIEKYISNINIDNYLSMSEVLNRIKSDKIFLKIDIEGYEYRILNSILENSDRITGLAIEFHDCDLHLDRIREFILNFQCKLIHVHANNSSYIDNNQLPLTLELTFSKHAQLIDNKTLPHPLDMPNNKNENEIKLIFD